MSSTVFSLVVIMPKVSSLSLEVYFHSSPVSPQNVCAEPMASFIKLIQLPQLLQLLRGFLSQRLWVAVLLRERGLASSWQQLLVEFLDGFRLKEVGKYLRNRSK